MTIPSARHGERLAALRRRTAHAAGRVAVAVGEAAAVLLPVDCAGCGRADRAVCPECRAALEPALRRVDAGVAGWAAADYGGVLRAVLHAVKERGRTDAVPALAPLLRRAVVAALAEADPLPPHPGARSAPPTGRGGARIELATVPSSRAAEAARGFRPVERMLAAAGLASSGVLRLARDRADQAGLGLADRAANLDGALAARGRLDGRRFLVVDDVVTSGATAREAVRALRAAGAEVVGAAFAAATPRRHAAFTAPAPASTTVPQTFTGSSGVFTEEHRARVP